MANPGERGLLRRNRRLWRFIIWGGLGVLLAMFVPALLPKGMGTVAYSAVSFGLLAIAGLYLIVVIVWTVVVYSQAFRSEFGD